MKPIVSEDFGDFLKEELYPAIEDGVDEDPIDTSGMPDMEEDEVDVEDKKDEIRKILRNELLVPEYAREPFIFMMKNSDQFEAIPMAEFPSGNTFVVNCYGENRKVKIEDIVDVIEISDDEEINEDADANGYSFSDYMFEIQDHIKDKVPDWDALIGDDEIDLIEWLEKNQDLWDLQSLYYAGVTAEDASAQIIQEIQAVEEEDDEE